MKRKEWSRQGLKSKVVRDMKDLGTYKFEYGFIIDVYVDLQIQYVRAVQEFEDNGYEYEVETAAGGTKKSGLVSTLESLRKDIITYSDRLMLNPRVTKEKASVEDKEKEPTSPFGAIKRPGV